MADRSALDLRILAVNTRRDLTLERLAILAETGTGVPVGLVVDGAVMIGTLARSEQWGKRLDAVIDRSLAQAEDYFRRTQEGGKVPPAVAARFEWIRGLSAEAEASKANAAIDDIQRRITELVGDRDDWKLTDLPDELAYDFIDVIEGSDIMLTLTDVRVAAGGDVMQVPLARVSQARIGAWWPIEPTGTTYTEG